MQRQASLLTIRGRVQGVSYRLWAQQQAQRLGLDGWVRNRMDGSVELLAIGLEPAIAQLIRACNRGPPIAAVSEVERAMAEDDGSLGFQLLPTA
ncbi:MAG TPA: acylphosphatase [Caulobacteraceae bacterium]|jgi:acylphosphatase